MDAISLALWDETANEPRMQVVADNEGATPYQEWFDEEGYWAFGEQKYTFLVDRKPILLFKDYRDFSVWLRDIRACLTKGFNAKSIATEDLASWQLDKAKDL